MRLIHLSRSVCIVPTGINLEPCCSVAFQVSSTLENTGIVSRDLCLNPPPLPTTVCQWGNHEGLLAKSFFARTTLPSLT